MKFAHALMLRTVLIGAVGLVGTNTLYQHWIQPLETRQAEGARELADVRERLESARREMVEIKKREQTATALRQALKSLHENLPEAAASHWLPTRLKMTLSRFGVAQATVQWDKAVDEPAIPDCERAYCRVTIPREAGLRKVADALLAVAQIEQQDHFVSIQELSFHLDTPEAGGTTGSVNLAAVVPKRNQ